MGKFTQNSECVFKLCNLLDDFCHLVEMRKYYVSSINDIDTTLSSVAIEATALLDRIHGIDEKGKQP